MFDTAERPTNAPWSPVPCSASEYDPAQLPAQPDGPLVLVAENDEGERLGLRGKPRAGGPRVVSCACVREAVRMREWVGAMVGEPYSLDVVTTDLRLGETDGLVFLELAAREGPELPVVVMSDFAGVRARVRASAAGVAVFLDKPASIATLLRLVRQLAQERRRRVRETANAPRPGLSSPRPLN